MTTTAEALYQDPSAAVADRVADLLGRMTLDEKLAQLGSAWVFQLADRDGLDVGARHALARRRDRPHHEGERRLEPHGGRRGHARQRRAAPPARAHATRHPGDHPRGDLLGPDGARRRHVRPSHRRGRHVPSGAQPGDGRRDPPADALDRSPPGPVARARRVPRPALGSPRGDLRRGPVPRHPDGRRVRPRPPGRRSRRRRARHGEALRRVRGVGGGPQLGARAPPRARAARRLPAPVRSRRSRRRRGHRDERATTNSTACRAAPTGGS